MAVVYEIDTGIVLACGDVVVDKENKSVQVSGISLVAGDKIYVKSIGTSSVSYQAFGEVSV